MRYRDYSNESIAENVAKSNARPSREIPDAILGIRNAMEAQEKSIEALRLRLYSVLRNEPSSPETPIISKALPQYNCELANNLQECEKRMLQNAYNIDELNRLLEI